MTGGFWAPIVIPIVATIALFSWVGAVFYAAAHPRWRGHTPAPVQHITGIREPIDAVEEREPAMTPGAGASPSQAGATAPKPREPSESEQLERQARERRLPGDERVGQGIDRGQPLARFGAEVMPGGHGRGVVVGARRAAVIAGPAWALSSVIVSSSGRRGHLCRSYPRGARRANRRRVVQMSAGCYA